MVYDEIQMPKINNIHKHDRLRERAEQLKRGDEVAIKDLNALLTKEQQQQMKDAWTNEKTLRDTNVIGEGEWKSIRDIRIEYLSQVLAERDLNVVVEFDELAKQREIQAAKIFLDAYFAASEKGENAMSKANIALQKSGFKPIHAVRTGRTTRDKEVQKMESALRERFKAEMTNEEREQLEMAQEYDKEREKRAKK